MASNEILDSWEDFQDFDTPSSRKKKPKEKSKAEISDTTSDVVVMEDTHRTQYKPQIRILKREPQQSKNANGFNDRPTANPNNGEVTTETSQDKPKMPGKTLAQREAEYAEARLRILGSAYNPEEQTSTQFPPVPSLAELVPPYPPPPIAPNNPAVPQPLYENSSPRLLLQRMQNLQINPEVVRQPNGPDGTRGFNGSSLPNS